MAATAAVVMVQLDIPCSVPKAIRSTEIYRRTEIDRSSMSSNLATVVVNPLAWGKAKPSTI